MSEMNNEALQPEENKNLPVDNQEDKTPEAPEITLHDQALIEKETEEKDKSADEIIDDIQHQMATESEMEPDETKEKIEIHTEAWKGYSLKDLVSELRDLLDQYPVEKISKYIYDLRNVFNKKLREEKNTAYQKYVEENETDEGFSFKAVEKEEFDALFREFRKRLEDARNKWREELQQNLEKKEAILEELKKLARGETAGTAPELFKKFKELKDKWHEIKRVPRDKYRDLWMTWNHWEEQFFDLLELDRDYRAKLFEENLKEKQKILEKAKELLNRENVLEAYRELQFLHKVWKENTGPVAPEYREKVWQEFKDLTKQIHDKRRAYFEALKKVYEANYEKKKALLEKIKEVSEQEFTTYDEFIQVSRQMDELKKEFFSTGYVPLKLKDEIRNEFKEYIRAYNKKKNAFFKTIKELRKQNLEKKLALIEEVKKLKESEDLKKAYERCKEIREEWRTIGGVPRKDAEKIWEEFKKVCKDFFDHYYSIVQDQREQEFENYLKKKNFLQALKQKIKNGEFDENLSTEQINQIIEEWKALGSVPDNVKFINVKFNKVIQNLYRKLNIDEEQIRLMKYQNMLDQWIESGETEKILKERRFIRNRIESLEHEIQNAERNLEFFHASDEGNPLIKKLKRKLEREKSLLSTWKKKQELINKLKF